MNLKALFNFNFFKENIRKSKGLLAFLLGIIPIINIIYLIILVSTSKSNLLSFNSLALITYLGMIFIPLALSLTLYGFVLKKKSVDFIMSKPISRKNIFLTNTIGGIILITLFMLINTCIFGLFSLLFNNITIPLALLFDYFIFWLVSYIFMFIVINLAIIISGNIITSLVVALIIVLLVPFFKGINYLTNEYYTSDNYILCESEECKPVNYYCYNDDTCKEHLANHEYKLYFSESLNYNFTAPLAILNNFPEEANTLYNTLSIVKMLILSVIYTIVGYIIFKRRKLENNEISFKKEKNHYLVKAITLIPVSFIGYLIVDNASSIAWLIVICGALIYSIVYDLITRKEIFKPVKSCIITLVLFISFICLYGLNFMFANNHSEVIKNVDTIYYENMVIKDKDLINYITKSLLEENNSVTYYYDDLILQDKNKKYIVTADFPQELVDLLDDELKIWNNRLLDNFNYDKIDYIEYNSTYIPVTKKIRTLIKENIGNIKNVDATSKIDTLYLYHYKNHQYESVKIPLKLTEELAKEVINYQNELYLISAKKNNYISYTNIIEYETNIFTEEDYFVFDYVIKSNMDKFINYLENNNEVDLSKELSYINIYDMKNEYIVTISDTLAFKKEFDSYKENLKDNPEYQWIYTEEDYEY